MRTQIIQWMYFVLMQERNISESHVKLYVSPTARSLPAEPRQRPHQISLVDNTTKCNNGGATTLPHHRGCRRPRCATRQRRGPQSGASHVLARHQGGEDDAAPKKEIDLKALNDAMKNLGAAQSQKTPSSAAARKVDQADVALLV